MEPEANDPTNPNAIGNPPDAPGQAPESPKGYRLTAAREAEILSQARALGDAAEGFPGLAARRVTWLARIQLAAERDAADLIRTPFPEGQPQLTREEIAGMRDKLEVFRKAQSRWTSLRRTRQRATLKFDKISVEVDRHKKTLLRFFDFVFKEDAAGRQRVSALRKGRSAASIVQHVSDLLSLCDEQAVAIAGAPRGEAAAVARLTAISPVLARVVADKTLTDSARDARKLRDATFTLVCQIERRIRAAAEYWYDGTEKLDPYAPFPTSKSARRGKGGDEKEDEDELDEVDDDGADDDADEAEQDADELDAEG